MDGFTLNDILASDPAPKASRGKQQKRKWREIEALKERKRLQKELMDIDVFSDYSLEDIDL